MIPKYDRPGAPIPDRWPGGDAYLTNQPTTRPSDAARLTRREFFCDEKLRQVIEMAVRNNRDLRLAALNVERARAAGWTVTRGQRNRRRKQTGDPGRSFGYRQTDDCESIRGEYWYRCLGD